MLPATPLIFTSYWQTSRSSRPVTGEKPLTGTIYLHIKNFLHQLFCKKSAKTLCRNICIFKGTWQWGGFSGVFCRNWFLLMSPLHYLLSHSDFCLKFAEIFIFEKRLPAITDTGSRQLRISVIRGVADSPHHWYAESPTACINDTESRLLNFLKENSLCRWYRESSTPRTSDTVCPRLPVSLIRRVAIWK